VFDGIVGKVLGFITAYKLYIRMKMRGEVVIHVRRVGRYMEREHFGGGDEEAVKVAELRRL